MSVQLKKRHRSGKPLPYLERPNSCWQDRIKGRRAIGWLTAGEFDLLDHLMHVHDGQWVHHTQISAGTSWTDATADRGVRRAIYAGLLEFAAKDGESFVVGSSGHGGRSMRVVRPNDVGRRAYVDALAELDARAEAS